MKGYRFYLEYPSKTEKNKATVKKPGNHTSTVVAVYLEPYGRGWTQVGHIAYSNGEAHWMYDCACAIFDTPNSSVASSSVQDEYLAENCKRIPERLAREIHPRLFVYLEEDHG